MYIFRFTHVFFFLGSRQIKFTNSGPSAKGKKSHFVKKSAILTSGKNFKFNFPVEEIEQLHIFNETQQKENSRTEELNNEIDKKIQENISNAKSEALASSNNTLSFKFVPSENTFRFNFNVDSEES